ncbi:MAG: alpha/beta hydrolase [Acetobacteraceae bacterium]|nr:alpha/beta hydrolase [Acetobacteraceae bacterium]
MAMPVYPTIVVPGITASYLTDEYQLPPQVVWSVMTKEFERAAMHPDNTRFEAVEPARVVPGQVFEVAYRELIEELRHNLSTREDLPVPVFPFGYDWRQPLDLVEQKLAAFIDEVIARTKLLRHYDREGYATTPKVNLVGHSMGGLVIAGYLQRAGAAAPVHKVATLATPFQGSFEAVIKITTGTSDLGSTAPSSREREAARLTPALYHLLPSFAEGVEIDPALPQSLLEPGAWQPSILRTLEEFVRKYGLGRSNRGEQAAALFAAMLDRAKAHRARTDSLNLADCGLGAASWLCVVGMGSTTRVRLEVERRGQAGEFRFRTTDRQNGWSDNPAGRTPLTGDGTVPYAGAVPKFLAPENLVCVTPDDYGYWEVQDRALTAVAGFHGILPNMDMLHRMIVAHLSERPDRYGNIWGWRAPGVETPNWPIAGMKVK